jgi:putative inorganic carbon (hco3(-)) transporter
MLVALIDTVSRGGMLGLGAALIVGILFAGPRRRPVLLLITAVVALGIVGYYASFASQSARHRITSIQGGSGRVDIWAVGWRMVKAKPITGVGAGNFANSTIHYLLEPGALQHTDFIVDEPKVAHNMYLEALADLGIPGLTLFLGLLVLLLSCVVRAARIFYRLGDQSMELISRGIFVATVGILVTDFFISDQFSKPLWIQLAICPCMLALARRMEAGTAED